MSPDKVHTVALMANAYRVEWAKRNDIWTSDKDPLELFAAKALKLYEECARQVRASGPTSKPLKPQVEACSHCACRVCETEMKRREDAGE